MLNTWGDFNKVVLQPRQEWTETERVDGMWSWNFAINVILWITVAYRVNNRKTEHYQYVGMDYETACSCAEEQIDDLTQDVHYSEWNTNTGAFVTRLGGKTCIGKVSVQNTGASMYCVDVTIDYTETLMSRIPET